MLVHLDADAFFASVEQAADPKLRGKPIAVGGEKRGIIASASYEARKMGIYTPMPTAHARKLCPRLIVLPGNFERYELFSRFMFSYAYDFTPNVEIASIDEGYFDLGGANRKTSPLEVADTIRRAIFESLKISVSEGIASNKLVSQVASKLRKPACFMLVNPGEEKGFLAPLPNVWLPGVGPKVSSVLNSAGLQCIQQIAETPADQLALFVGNYAPQLRLFANGVDERPVVPERAEAKSFGEQETFAEDTTDEAFLLAKLRSMTDRLMSKVREEKKSIRTVTLRLRYNDMDETTRSQSLEEPTDLELDVYPLLGTLLKRAWERRVSIRLVSVKLSNLYKGGFRNQLILDEQSRANESHRKLSAVIDQMRKDYNKASVIMRGHDLWLKKQEGRPQPDFQNGPSRPSIKSMGSISSIKSIQSIRPTSYAALNVKSFYSFLDSTLSIPDIIRTASQMGIQAVALTDPNLHGAVEFFTAAKEVGIKPIIGAEVRFANASSPRLFYVRNQTGYTNLCRILSRPAPERSFVEAHREGLLEADPAQVALPEIRYRLPGDRQKFDILQSIRTLTLLNQPHPEKRSRGDFHFLSPEEAATLYSPQAISASLQIAEQCEFEFDLDRLRFPNFLPPNGGSPSEFLRQLAMEGLRRRYSGRASQFQSQLEEELAIIRQVGYEEYFLTVWDFLQECKRRGIDWITRGSAADSLVCYCLGISGVCPIRFELYFRRFLNKERMALNKLPDIDIDFPHDRKDDVVDLIFERSPKGHVAIVGGFSTFHARSAVAEIAKVLGISEYQVRRLTRHIPWARAGELPAAISQSTECKDIPWKDEPFKTAVELAQILEGFPRYPKMHPCGLVLSRDPIEQFTPVFQSNKGYPTTHLDMDAIEAVGLVKMDILAQGGLAVMRDALAHLALRGIQVDLEKLAPWEDPKVWEMIAEGDSRGVHHIESPAMIGLARMCNVRDIDRLIAIVSVIRPGAANSMKKVQFAKRAQGQEPVEYLHPSLEPVLRSTFGVVAYEEHILQICEAFAGLDPGRADVLRRALGKQQMAKVHEIRGEFFASARALGREEAIIAAVWELVEGFQGYAFCRAHSTAYGVEAYQGAYLKRYHPLEFLAAILTHGKGFYTPLAYTLECRRLGIGFLSPDVNESGPGFRPVPELNAIRVPLRQVKELAAATLQRWESQRSRGPFKSLRDFFLRVNPSLSEMHHLLRAGAFDSFGRKRTADFWELHRLAHAQASQDSLFEEHDRARVQEVPPALQVPLKEPTLASRLKDERELLSFTVSGHPLDDFPEVAWETYCPINELYKFPNQEVTTCGLIIQERLYSQVTGDPMKFITICDYTGMVECELFAETYARFGLATVRYEVLEVTATVVPFETARVPTEDGKPTRNFSLQVHQAGKPRIRNVAADVRRLTLRARKTEGD
jgi:DNA polymerase-3 subunit alpha